MIKKITTRKANIYGLQGSSNFNDFPYERSAENGNEQQTDEEFINGFKTIFQQLARSAGQYDRKDEVVAEIGRINSSNFSNFVSSGWLVVEYK
jgi:hypothetical protein